MKLPAILDKILRPEFLRQQDLKLLKNHPHIWRLQVHWVILYALVTIVVMFLAGYFSPMSFYTLGNEPNSLYDKRSEIVTVAMSLLAFLGFFVWRHKLSHFPSTHFSWRYTLLEVLLYFVCVASIFIAIQSFYRGLALKKIQKARAYHTLTKEKIASNNFFFPMYAPHCFSEKHKDQATYFKHGEALAGRFLQRTFEIGSIYNYSYYSIPTIEMECEHLRFSPDTVKNTWFQWANNNSDSLTYPLSPKYSFIPHLPFLFSGLTYEESTSLLDEMPSVFTDTFRTQAYRYKTPTELYELGFRRKGIYVQKGITTLNDTTAIAHFHWFFADYFDFNQGRLSKLFAQKAFLESLNEVEKAGYKKYLAEISKIANPTSLVFEYETIIPSQNSTDRYHFHEGLTDTLFFSNERRTIGTHDITQDEQAQIVSLFPVFNTWLSSLDLLSRYWYRHYLSYSTGDAYCPQNPGECTGQLLSEYPKPLDSLLFYDFFHRGKYYFCQTDFHQDRYLDYYFKQYSPEKLDSLRIFLQTLGYPLNTLPADASGKVLLFEASKIYERASRIKYFVENDTSDWCKLNEVDTYLLLFSFYLALLMFFIGNTDTTGMLKNFVVVAIILGLISLMIELTNARRDSFFIQTASLIFILGLPAIATIIFLAKAKFMSKNTSIFVQLQMVFSFVAIIAKAPYRVFDISAEDFPYFHILVFAYWITLLTVIAVLFRRHQSMPEKV